MCTAPMWSRFGACGRANPAHTACMHASDGALAACVPRSAAVCNLTTAGGGPPLVLEDFGDGGAGKHTLRHGPTVLAGEHCCPDIECGAAAPNLSCSSDPVIIAAAHLTPLFETAPPHGPAPASYGCGQLKQLCHTVILHVEVSALASGFMFVDPQACSTSPHWGRCAAHHQPLTEAQRPQLESSQSEEKRCYI